MPRPFYYICLCAMRQQRCMWDSQKAQLGAARLLHVSQLTSSIQCVGCGVGPHVCGVVQFGYIFSVLFTFRVRTHLGAATQKPASNCVVWHQHPTGACLTTYASMVARAVGRSIFVWNLMSLYVLARVVPQLALGLSMMQLFRVAYNARL